MTLIRLHTGWSNDVLDFIGSKNEALIYIRAGLKEDKVGGRTALFRFDIDWSNYSIRRNTWLKNKLADYDRWAGYNNADLIGEGFPPLITSKRVIRKNKPLILGIYCKKSRRWLLLSPR